MPWVVGQSKIYIGDDVNFFGKVDIFSGAQLDEPRLVLKDRVDIGHNVIFMVNREIVLEEDVNVASGVRFMDSDAHPRDTMARIADLPASPDEIKAVRIKRYAWIGHNVFIMKGVTVGEGAIIGVNSVVLNDIPDYSVAIGNPARVIVKNINRAERRRRRGGGGDGSQQVRTNRGFARMNTDRLKARSRSELRFLIREDLWRSVVRRFRMWPNR